MDDFSPSKLVEHTYEGASHRYSIIMDPFGPVYLKTNTTFAACAIQEPGGYAWEGVAKSLIALRAPELAHLIGYDAESSMFAAYGNDHNALLGLAQLIREAQDQPQTLQAAIEHALHSGEDLD